MAKKKPSARKPVRSPKKPKTAAAAAGVLLVNMIPNALSGESNQDSEPMIAVDPNNPDHIVGTAFTPDPMGGSLAPIYVSTDGGQTWTLHSIVPGGQVTGDITVAFSGTADKLYAGILRLDSPTPNITRMSILRTDNFASLSAMSVVTDRQQPDQPFTLAATVANGTDQGKERVYVGNNDFAGAPQTATIDISTDGGAVAPTFKSIRIEKRSTATAGQNGPQVRPTVHADGTVYAAFYGWRSQSGSWPANTLKVTADVVVVRDDDWGTGATPFEDLKDAGDGVAGMRVVKGVQFAFDRNGKSSNGQQRLGGSLSIAVDPREDQSGTVYLAWGDDRTETGFTLHVRRSTNKGVAWSSTDLLTLPRATNGAVAINSDGVVGLLYQQLTGTGSHARWETHFRSSTDGSTWSDLVLASTPASAPAKTFDPYLGDYDHLVSVGKDFYGIFSANNTPDLTNFPSGVKYQRNADFTSRKLFALNGTTPVQASIDPFFFKVSG
jgi:hypothetical protein